MLDNYTRQIISNIRNSTSFLLFEEEKNGSETENGQVKDLNSDDDTYQKILTDLREKISTQSVNINYIRVTHNTGYSKIEVSGGFQNNLAFLMKYGNENGVFISSENWELTVPNVEGIRLLHIYYDTDFTKLCKELLED